MRGGSLTRYHTPVVTAQERKGLAEDLIKISAKIPSKLRTRSYNEALVGDPKGHTTPATPLPTSLIYFPERKGDR